MNLMREFCPDDPLVYLTANVLAQIAAVAALASMLSWGFARRSAAVRHGIWGTAFVCTLISPFVSYLAAEGGLSLVTLPVLPPAASADLETSPPQVPNAPVNRGSSAADWHLDADPQQHAHATAYLPPRTTPDVVPTPPVRDPRQALLGLTTLVWFIGALLLTVRLVHGWLNVLALQRHVRPAEDDRLRRLLPEIRSNLNVQNLPRLRILSRRVRKAGPITIGLFRPQVVLPEHLVKTLDCRGLRDVLLHEFAHALRYDPLVGFLQRLLAIVFWPYPPVHLVNRRLAEAREEVCDNYVLRQGDAPSYVETLLTITETFPAVRTPSTAMGICHPQGRLERRVADLLDPGRNVMTRVHRTTQLALTALFLTALLIVAGTRLLRAESPAADADQAEAKPTVQQYTVNMRVKDFAKKDDLSSPETAVAAMCRALGQKDIQTLDSLIVDQLGKELAYDIEQSLKHDPAAPENLSEMMLETEIVDVLTYRDQLALVIVKSPAPLGEQPFPATLLIKVGGQWKGILFTGLEKAGLENAQEAREYFEEKKDDLWRSLVEQRDKKRNGQRLSAPDRRLVVKGPAKSSEREARTWTLPNGTRMSETSSEPQISDELQELIAAKEYEFVQAFDSISGERQYVYSFVLPDGGRVARNFSLRLEKVASWEDYLQKRKLQRERRREKINQAIAAGRFRLLDLEVTQIHLCRDALSDQKFKIQRIRLQDGSEIASPRPDYARIPSSVNKTSWQEHQQAIRDGRRTLLDVETVKRYTYEMTADDGTKVRFQYGGSEPLKIPENKNESG